MKRIALAVLAVFTFTACGADSTAPPRYPALSGTFQLDGTFNDTPASSSSLSGTVTFSQADRNDSTLSGTANVTVHILSSTITLATVRNARIHANGDVIFELPPQNTASTWTFTGSLSGTTIIGTHSLVNAAVGPPSNGTFTARKLATP